MIGERLGDSSGGMLGEGSLGKSQSKGIGERLDERLDKKLDKVFW